MSKIENALIDVISEALKEINDICGYEIIELDKIKDISKRFLTFLPFMENLFRLKGLNLNDIEKEINLEKGKRAALLGMFHGIILKYYNGNTFKEKYEHFLYNSNIQSCDWIKKTQYDNYYKKLFELILKIKNNSNNIEFINIYSKHKNKSTTQAITKINTKENFFCNNISINEKTIDEYIEIFRELCSVIEGKLKLMYGIKYSFTSKQIIKLEKTKFFDVWNDLKNDDERKLFTKPFPNTIYWNASKHNGITKKVNDKSVTFISNEGEKTISYEDFIQLVRELYACTVILIKTNLILTFQTLK